MLVRRLVQLCALLLPITGLALLGVVSSPGAQALAAPVVDPPKCFPRAVGITVDCYDVLPDGTYGPFGMGATISGTATPDGTFTIVLNPGDIPACTTHEQRGCFDAMSHHHDGGLFYMPYANSLVTQRAVKWVEGPMSTHAPTLRSVLPETGDCRTDWQYVYADGGDFAGRAAAGRTCVFRFKYQNAAGQQVPLDNLQGPTWLRIRSSVTYRKPEGGIEGKTVTSLVRVEGDLASGPVAQCVPPKTVEVGVQARFESISSLPSQIDSVANWAFDPGLIPSYTFHSGTTHKGGAYVTPTANGPLRAIVTYQSWQGTSQSVCTVAVGGVGHIEPEPEATCALSGSPSLKGKARVGKKVKVKPGPWAVPGATLTYQWKVGGKNVGKRTARALKLKAAHRGSKVKVKVTAKAPDCAVHTVTLKAGKVRR